MNGLSHLSSVAPAGDDPASPPTETIAMGWWNVGPFPCDRSKTSGDKKNAIQEMVKHLIDDVGVDLLALGEVTHDELLTLKAGCTKSTLALYDGTQRDGQLKFDSGVLYNMERLTLLDDEAMSHRHYNRRLKLANRLQFRIEYDKSTFQLFVTHWPSRAITQENAPARSSLANQLRQKMVTLNRDGDPSPVIILGDFNDEPFDEALVTGLFATRDRTLAASGDFLYNPFWRHLGEATLYSILQSAGGFAGTHFHSSGTETKWRTFDQILFSSAFLGNGEWHLDERRTGPLVPTSTFDFGRKSAMFDHLPVLSVIERATEGVSQ